jgi:purine-binding chemotaxis protein CheW
VTSAAARGFPMPADVRDGADVVQIVTFRVGGDFFAADVQAVERVLRYKQVTPVPNLPDWVAGVHEYQKRVVPVVDLRVRFELPRETPNADTRIIVFNTSSGWTGGIVDAVLDVSAIERGRLETPPPLLRGLAAEYLHGIARRDGQLVLLLDADRVLSSTERALLRQVIGDTGGQSASEAPDPSIAPISGHRKRRHV